MTEENADPVLAYQQLCERIEAAWQEIGQAFQEALGLLLPHLLGWIERFGHFQSNSALLDTLREAFDHTVMNICLQQCHPNFTHRLIDISLR